MDLTRTVDLMTRARRVLGWGARSIDVRPLFFGEAVLPQLADTIGGCEVVDTQGQRYVDWYGGSCNLLGYREPRVENAVREQLLRGPLLPFVHELEVEVAERLVEMIPCAEMVAFGKNGSDGVTAAVRLARMLTGRDVILFYGYLGFHDWYAAYDPVNEGIPLALRELLHPFVYNDLESVRTLMARFDGRVAAIVMEPTKDVLPAPGFLEGLRQLTRDAGSLFIFDEVVTALRLGAGGAQEAFGVIPDLACIGKSLGNGMPVSAILGPRAIMQHFPRAGVGMTFQGESLSLAAARTVLQIVREEPVARRIAATGETLRAAFDAEAQRAGIAASLTGHPARPQLSFADRGDFPGDYLRGVFLTDCLRRGVITGPTMLPSYAHDDAAIAKTIAVFRESLEVVARLVEQPFRGWVLPGEPDLLGFVDSIAGHHVGGWLFVNGGAAEELTASTLDGTLVAIARVDRQDVAAVYPQVGHAASSGFTFHAPAAVPILLRARRGTALARCVVAWNGATLPLGLQQGRVS
jgi:glutamate-1-semialdehyde aminotransferase